MGMRFDQLSSFWSPLIKGYGEPTYLADAASASYSREREIAIWMSMAAMGAKISMRMPPNGAAAVVVIAPPVPPNQKAMRATMVMAAAMVAATS